MKRIISLLIVAASLSLLAAQTLETGNKRKFVPGDKVIFAEDFSSCPVGELPSSFDKLEGMGECVKYGDSMYFTSVKNRVFAYKMVNLGSDEFSVEFDLLFLKPECREFGVTFFGGKRLGEKQLPYYVSFGPGCSGEAVYASLEGVGRIYKSNYKSLKRKIHVAIQVRRKQFRVFLDGKRLAMVPFNGNVTSIRFSSFGEYSELITNIRIAKYTRTEEKPSPEKLGIKVKKTAQGTTLTIPEKVLFDFNQFFLKPEAKKALHVVAQILKEQPDKKILIVGYTDNIGSDAYNLRLSLQRAQSVADYLIYVEGIDKNRIKIEGKGKANPIADNSTEEGRAQNRRVEIKIY